MKSRLPLPLPSLFRTSLIAASLFVSLMPEMLLAQDESDNSSPSSEEVDAYQGATVPREETSDTIEKETMASPLEDSTPDSVAEVAPAQKTSLTKKKKSPESKSTSTKAVDSSAQGTVEASAKPKTEEKAQSAKVVKAETKTPTKEAPAESAKVKTETETAPTVTDAPASQSPEADPASTSASTPSTSTSVSSPSTSTATDGSGEKLEFKDLKFSVTAPTGWKVHPNAAGMTIVFEDLTPSKVGFTSFTRNITVAVQTGAKSIDTMEQERFSQKLIEQYSKSVSDFQIIESRIIDYRFKADAILVFSSYNSGKTPMRQMHIFTSGSERNVLLTFTDLQESFEADGALNRAWASMMSAQLEGQAPKRYEGLMYGGAGFTLFASFLFFGNLVRRRQQMKRFRDEESLLFDDVHSSATDDSLSFVGDDLKTSVASATQTNDWQIAETSYVG